MTMFGDDKILHNNHDDDDEASIRRPTAGPSRTIPEELQESSPETTTAVTGNDGVQSQQPQSAPHDSLPLLFYERQALVETASEVTCSCLGQVVLDGTTAVETQQQQQQQQQLQSSQHTATTTTPFPMTASSATNNNPTTTTTGTAPMFAGQEIPIGQWHGTRIPLCLVGRSDGSVALLDAQTAAVVHGFLDDRTTTTATTNRTTTAHPTSQGTTTTTSTAAAATPPIVAVGSTTTGTVWAALDASGQCWVWTVQYRLTYQPAVRMDDKDSNGASGERQGSNNNNNTTSNAGTTSSWSFWKSAASKSTAFSTTLGSTTSTTAEGSTTNTGHDTDTTHHQQTTMVPTLSCVNVVLLTHCVYPLSDYGSPTGLAVASRNQWCVTFDTGKVVVSSTRHWTNFLLHTAIHNVDHVTLPYTGPVRDADWKGIEAVAWQQHAVAATSTSGDGVGATTTTNDGNTPTSSNTTVSGGSTSGGGGGGMTTGETSSSSNDEARLLAFCDCSGIKLYDGNKPVAHIDRPLGAVPSLYPGCTVIPQLYFSGSDVSRYGRGHCGSLLVAWGDCLMSLQINAPNNARGNSQQGTTAAAAAGSSSSVVSSASNAGNNANDSTLRRRCTVQCTMAWGLDCMAMGVAPQDEATVAVLGVLPDIGTMELQLIDRASGSIVVADELQLMPIDDDSSRPISSTRCQLHTTFTSDSTWSLRAITGEDGAPGETGKKDGMSNNEADDDSNSVNSTDSDDYGFLLSSSAPRASENNAPLPPTLMIVCANDYVVCRVRNVDDAIDAAIEADQPATALRRAMAVPQHQLKRHTLSDLIEGYLRAILRPKQHLSLRRMKVAALALPILLGGNVDAWSTWVAELENIPGALFIVRDVLPVRDPKLPKVLYGRVLRKMLEEVESMTVSSDPNAMNRLVLEAEGHFLNTLVSWGTTRALREHIKLFEYLSEKVEANFEAKVRLFKDSLRHRAEQSAVGFLNRRPSVLPPEQEERKPICASQSLDAVDSLYDVDELIYILSRRISVIAINSNPLDSPVSPQKSLSTTKDSKVALDSLARLYMMNGTHDEALRCFLALGALHASKSTEDIEQEALDAVNFASTDKDSPAQTKSKSPYSFIVSYIETQHLYQCLLESDFLPDHLNTSPIAVLIRLVGLELAGTFLIKNCVAPQTAASCKDAISAPCMIGSSDKTTGERRGTLPLDLVADQLSESPKLFHWYLHLVFLQKPEVYVRFPNTANPPPVISELHKKHLDLYIKYAGPNRDSARALAGVEVYRVAEKETPLLSFLKVILQLGAIGPLEVGKMLEIERRGGAGVSRTMALELAYIMENYGNGTESDSQLMLELYLKGTQSLMLAVSYAQRTKEHSSILWQSLIDHCLGRSNQNESTESSTVDGALFGSLLEAAALSGADLAHLVAQIPPGMQVEGLKPRLVAAVADYRLNVQLHSASTAIAVEEKACLYYESAQRSRRGMCFDGTADSKTLEELKELFGNQEMEVPEEQCTEALTLSSDMRPKNRPGRHSHVCSVAIR